MYDYILCATQHAQKAKAILINPNQRTSHLPRRQQSNLDPVMQMYPTDYRLQKKSLDYISKITIKYFLLCNKKPIFIKSSRMLPVDDPFFIRFSRELEEIHDLNTQSYQLSCNFEQNAIRNGVWKQFHARKYEIKRKEISIVKVKENQKRKRRFP